MGGFSTVVVVAALLFTGQAFGADDFFGHVRINYIQKRAGKDSNKKKNETRSAWISGCRQLGSALTPRSSPWVYGVFDTFSCQMNGKTIYGEKRKSQYVVEVVDSKSGIKISVIQSGRSKKDRSTLTKYSLEPTQNFAFFLKDQEFVDMLAISLSESLPAAGVITKNSDRLKDGNLQVAPVRKGNSPSLKYTYPALPSELTLYRMNWDRQDSIWRSQVVGTAKLKSNGNNGGSYALDKTVLAELNSGPVYLHRSEGPQNAGGRWTPSLKESTQSLDQAFSIGKFGDFLKGVKIDLLDSLLSSAASGYVGFKYGMQILPPEGELGRLIGKTKLLSVLVEIRSGPVKGLRYYYDKLPETKAKVDMADGSEEEQFIGFSRHIIGYSFGLDLNGVIDRITVDPKLGIWTFNARLPAALDENGNVTKLEEFKLGRTFSLALEGGIESISDWYVLRAWAGMDTGFSLLKSGGKVSSYRFGLDAFLTAGPEIPFFGASLKTTWILFYLFDRMDISTKENIQLEAGEDAITGLAYDAAYAGAGVAVSW